MATRQEMLSDVAYYMAAQWQSVDELNLLILVLLCCDNYKIIYFILKYMVGVGYIFRSGDYKYEV